MTNDPTQKARDLVSRLQEQGHHAEAERLSNQISTVHSVENGLLFALRETCETILTAIEAIDPVTQTMIEELRVEVEKLLHR